MPVFSVNDAQVFNKALMRLGEKAKKVFDVAGADTSEYGVIAYQEYQSTRNEELRANSWLFSIKRAILVASAVPNNSGFTYEWTYPADCLRLVSCFVVLTSAQVAATYGTRHVHEVPFVEEQGVIYTDVNNVYARYVQELAVPQTWTEPLFVDALSLRLATKIVKAVVGSPSPIQERQDIWDEYNRVIARALAANLIESSRSELVADRKEDRSSIGDTLQAREVMSNNRTQ